MGNQMALFFSWNGEGKADEAISRRYKVIPMGSRNRLWSLWGPQALVNYSRNQKGPQGTRAPTGKPINAS